MKKKAFLLIRWLACSREMSAFHVVLRDRSDMKEPEKRLHMKPRALHHSMCADLLQQPDGVLLVGHLGCTCSPDGEMDDTCPAAVCTELVCEDTRSVNKQQEEIQEAYTLTVSSSSSTTALTSVDDDAWMYDHDTDG